MTMIASKLTLDFTSLMRVGLFRVTLKEGFTKEWDVTLKIDTLKSQLNFTHINFNTHGKLPITVRKLLKLAI